jgi:hypothetical protein
MHPKVRSDRVVAQSIGDELIVYDRRRHRAHRLNRTSALVWQLADGRRSRQEIGEELQRRTSIAQPDDVVEVALADFAALGLLSSPTGGPQQSRRDLLRLSGALAPFIVSLAIPSPAEALSYTNRNEVVVPPQTGPFITTSSSYGLVGATVIRFTLYSGGSAPHHWDFGDGTATTDTPSQGQSTVDHVFKKESLSVSCKVNEQTYKKPVNIQTLVGDWVDSQSREITRITKHDATGAIAGVCAPGTVNQRNVVGQVTHPRHVEWTRDGSAPGDTTPSCTEKHSLDPRSEDSIANPLDGKILQCDGVTLKTGGSHPDGRVSWEKTSFP